MGMGWNRDLSRLSSGRRARGDDSIRSFLTLSSHPSPNALRYTQSFGHPNGSGPYLPRSRFFKSSVAPE